MTFFGNFHFIRPFWLLMIPVAMGVWWLIRQSGDPLRGWRLVMDQTLLNALTIGGNANDRWRGTTLLAIWLLIILSISGPTWKPEPSPFADDPVPVMLVLCATETMNVEDLVPSRIERARLKVTDFANARKGLPLGLLAYSGTPHLVLPPTRDTSIVSTMAAEISPEIMPRKGDDLTAALKLAEQTLGQSGGSIVVLTDTVSPTDTDSLIAFHSTSKMPVHFLAIAREQTPEWDAIKQAASILKASTTLISADSSDIQGLLKKTATAPIAVTAEGEGTRWAEAGWWIVPIIALLSLSTFRREEQFVHEESAS